MPTLEEKKALLHEAILAKGVADVFSKKYDEAKAALRAFLEEDGEIEIAGDEGGRAFYKSAARVHVADSAIVSKLLNKEELVELVAGGSIPQKNVNFLLEVTRGRNISSLFIEVPSRSFTVDPPRTKEEKARIQKAIEIEAEKQMQELREHVEAYRKRLGLDERTGAVDAPERGPAKRPEKGSRKPRTAKSRAKK